jgi:hypothetical protein
MSSASSSPISIRTNTSKHSAAHNRELNDVQFNDTLLLQPSSKTKKAFDFNFDLQFELELEEANNNNYKLPEISTKARRAASEPLIPIYENHLYNNNPTNLHNSMPELTVSTKFDEFARESPEFSAFDELSDSFTPQFFNAAQVAQLKSLQKVVTFNEKTVTAQGNLKQNNPEDDELLFQLEL